MGALFHSAPIPVASTPERAGSIAQAAPGDSKQAPFVAPREARESKMAPGVGTGAASAPRVAAPRSIDKVRQTPRGRSDLVGHGRPAAGSWPDPPVRSATRGACEEEPAPDARLGPIHCPRSTESNRLLPGHPAGVATPKRYNPDPTPTAPTLSPRPAWGRPDHGPIGPAAAKRGPDGTRRGRSPFAAVRRRHQPRSGPNRTRPSLPHPHRGPTILATAATPPGATPRQAEGGARRGRRRGRRP